MKKICHPGALLICGAAGIYGTEPLTELVKLLKYSSMLSASEVLGDTLFEYAASLKIPIEDFIVMPIPLPKKRLRHRGFNQAELIAKSANRVLGNEISEPKLGKTRPGSGTSLATSRDST